ncbi:MAG: phosphatase PAP2 family protein, partial [Planctomycetota bacterium]
VAAIPADAPEVEHRPIQNTTHRHRGDLDRLFRVMGFVPTWLLAAGAWAMIRWRRVGELGWLKAMNAPILLAVSAGLSGAVAEGVKLMTRRLRPRETGGVYEWRSLWEDPFNSGDLGCPSSHAMVAFGAAWMLCRFYPAATPIWLLLGAGCAATRVVTHAHFVSDVTVSAFLSFAVAGVLWNWHRYNESREGVRTEPVAEAGSR